MISIQKFDKNDQQEVTEFVLNIQNNEFLLGFAEHEQPDLLDIATFYASGGFWTAKIDGKLVGTIGLQQLDNDNAILRKMFVHKECRGKDLNIAQQLFETLIDFAKSQRFKTIWLDTPAAATASHRFYERNGFEQADRLILPANYKFPDRNSRIYKLTIKS